MSGPALLTRVRGPLVTLGIVAVLALLNAYAGDAGLFGFGMPPYVAHIVILAGINITLAVSLNLINGFTGQFSIGHAGFMAIGAYVSTFGSVYATGDLEQALANAIGPAPAAALAFLLVITLGMAAAALAGLVVGAPSLRLRGDYLAIVTLGFAEIIRIVILNIDRVGGATGFRGAVEPWTGRPIIPAYTNFFWTFALAIATIAVVRNLVRSATGRALLAIREDELAAEAMGVNTTRYKLFAFVLSSALAGAAGALFAHYNQFLSTNTFQFILSFEIIIMVVLGGTGSLTGSVLGAILITALPEALRRLPAFELGGTEYRLADWRLVVYSALLIVVMLTRPQGLLGHREIDPAGIRRWLRRVVRRNAPREGAA